MELTSLDGGRTWLWQADYVVLSLVVPAAVSLFPLTTAMSSEAAYLNEGETEHEWDTHAVIAKDVNDLEPIVEVLEVQPLHVGRDQGRAVRGLKALIVISRAVPRPTEVSLPRPLQGCDSPSVFATRV